MAIIVKHTKVSAVVDSADTSLVRPSDWNSDHTLTGFGTSAALDAGVAGGVATLDGGGTVPLSQIPASIQGSLSYEGTWNASTNTPTLASGVGTKGYYYIVSVAGSTNLDGITSWNIGDMAVYSGTAWQKIDNTDAVTSVNGFTGSVVLTTTDVAEGTKLYYTDVRARASNSAGTGITYDSVTGVITNAAPDQTVALTAGTGISTSGTYPNFTITNTAPSSGGTVTSVTATAPVVSTGGTTPVISMAAVTTAVNGYLTSTDWNTFNNKTSNTGTVTSVATSVPSFLSVSGSPITTTGTLAISYSGTALPIANGGTGLSTVGTAGQVLTSNGTTLSYETTTTGTVTSVSATVPSVFSVSGSPITTNGTLALTYSGVALPVANGGTGVTAVGTSGNVLTSNGTIWVSQSPVGSNITAQGLYENAAIIAANYTIGTGNNAISAGPITINSGVTVTVSSGSTWVVL